MQIKGQEHRSASADVVGEDQRPAYLDGAWLAAQPETLSADPQLTADVDRLAGDSIVDL